MKPKNEPTLESGTPDIVNEALSQGSLAGDMQNLTLDDAAPNTDTAFPFAWEPDMAVKTEPATIKMESATVAPASSPPAGLSTVHPTLAPLEPSLVPDSGVLSSAHLPGERVWAGNLHVRGHRNDMVVPCVAVRYPTPHRASVASTTAWPLHLHCDSTKLKQCVDIFEFINEPASQWYVRFAPIDADGAECQQPKLVRLAKVMVHRQLAFEIHCDNSAGMMGALYLWGMNVPPYGFSLLGVFRPSTQPSLSGVSPSGPSNTVAGTGTAAAEGNFPIPHGVTAQENVTGMPNGELTGQRCRIWQGTLNVFGDRTDMVFSCHAVCYPTPHRPSVASATGWPQHLHCDSTKMKQCAGIFQYMNKPANQWYVRFAPIDGNGVECQQPQLAQFVKVMVQRHLAFEILCSTGTLYLWGMQMPPHGQSLLGMFCPSAQPSAGGVNATGPADAPPTPGAAAGAMGGQAQSGSDPTPSVAPSDTSVMSMLWSVIAGTAGDATPSGPGERIWRGNLRVRGHCNDMVVPCVVERYSTPQRPSVASAAGWPPELYCDSTKMKQCENVLQYMNEPASQWCVRLAPVDGNGVKCQHPKLVQLVRVMIHRELAFKISCEGVSGAEGMLYLWGMQLPQHGYSLMGVFAPRKYE